MKRRHSQSGLPLGIHKLSEIDLAVKWGKHSPCKNFPDREIRQTLSSVLPDVLNVFAKDSKIGNLS